MGWYFPTSDDYATTTMSATDPNSNGVGEFVGADDAGPDAAIPAAEQLYESRVSASAAVSAAVRAAAISSAAAASGLDQPGDHQVIRNGAVIQRRRD